VDNIFQIEDAFPLVSPKGLHDAVEHHRGIIVVATRQPGIRCA
jgi:hypothetical protein